MASFLSKFNNISLNSAFATADVISHTELNSNSNFHPKQAVKVKYERRAWTSSGGVSSYECSSPKSAYQTCGTSLAINKTELIIQTGLPSLPQLFLQMTQTSSDKRHAEFIRPDIKRLINYLPVFGSWRWSGSTRCRFWTLGKLGTQLVGRVLVDDFLRRTSGVWTSNLVWDSHETFHIFGTVGNLRVGNSCFPKVYWKLPFLLFLWNITI